MRESASNRSNHGYLRCRCLRNPVRISGGSLREFGAESILFVGTVLGGTIVSASRDDPAFDVRFRIDELFHGLPVATKDIVVRSGYAWFPGKTYLIHATRGRNGRVHIPICSGSGEISDRSVAQRLDYLRLREQGKTGTSLTVFVSDLDRPIADAQVMVTGSDGVLSRITDAKGEARFETITPGSHRISTIAAYRRGETQRDIYREVTIPYGTCAQESFSLLPDVPR